MAIEIGQFLAIVVDEIAGNLARWVEERRVSVVVAKDTRWPRKGRHRKELWKLRRR